MPFLFQYLLKFSISLMVMYTFYYLVLRPLTFYQWNRFYLIGYSLLSLVIPFINITAWLPVKNVDNSYLINSIPAVDKLTLHSFNTSGDKSILTAFLTWDVAGWLFLAGALIMLNRIIYQYLSLRMLKSKAVLLKAGDFEFYDVNGPITPFSFANAIFINSRLHSEEEFRKILEHEFVHVKQKHTIDIVVAELICVVNWFNPFAWLIRKAIRQNLEFIADKNVLDGGIDARQYQYLLLKVMGLPQYSITNNFSFSSLKKRIIMINKIKTARVHLIKFLFVLPLLSVMLLAFRDRINFSKDEKVLRYVGLVLNSEDNQPLENILIKELNTNIETLTNDKGFFELRIPVKKDKNEMAIRVFKDGILKMKVSSSWTKYGSGLLTSLIGIDNRSLDTTNFKNCYVRHQQVIDNTSNSEALTYATVHKILADYIEGMENLHTMRQINKPVVFIKSKMYFMAGNIPDEKGVSVGSFSVISLEYPKEYPDIYLNGAVVTVEKVNATISPSEIKSLQWLSKEKALKKYGKSKDVVEITLNSSKASDTIPKSTVSPDAPAVTTGDSLLVMPLPPVSALEAKPVKAPAPPSPIPAVKATPAKVPVTIISQVTAVKNITVTHNVSYKKQGKTITQKQAVTIKAPVTFTVPVTFDAPVKKANNADTIIPKQNVRGVSQTGPNQPIYIVDGIMLPEGKDIQNIEPNSISEINVWKGEQAIAIYGDKGKYGVVIIKTKEKYADDSISVTGSKIVVSNINEIKSLILVDGVETSKEKLSMIEPDLIKSISILKDNSAIRLYGEKGKNGVIIITTKKAL